MEVGGMKSPQPSHLGLKSEASISKTTRTSFEDIISFLKEQ